MSTPTNWRSQYKEGQRAFVAWLNGYGLRLRKAEDLGLQRDDDGWEHFAWRLTVDNRYHRDEDTFEFPYRQGVAHTKKPTLADLMSSLLSDASCVVDRSFDEFCDDLGYDSDSRKALTTYNQIAVHNRALMLLFRTTDLEGLLRKYEPLREAAGL